MNYLKSDAANTRLNLRGLPKLPADKASSACSSPVKSSSLGSLESARNAATLPLTRCSSAPCLKRDASQTRRNRSQKREAILRFACFLPALCSSEPFRIGVYIGVGTHGSQSRHFIRSVVASALRARGRAFTIHNLSARDVQKKLTRENLDIVIFPGGRADNMANVLKDDGLVAVSDFVQNGGGFIGICAGAYLAVRSLKFYGDTPTKEPVNRGRGDVDIEFTQAGLDTLRLHSEKLKRNIFYNNGPLIDEKDLPSCAEVLAHFRKEIPFYHPDQEGQMIDTPAIFGTCFGSGKVVACSPHPESVSPPMHDIYAGFVSYVAPDSLNS